MKSFWLGLASFGSLMFGVLGGNAATVSWKDPVSGNWSDPSRWLGGVVPTGADTVLIEASGSYVVTISGAVSCVELKVGGETGAITLNLGAGGLLDVSQSATLGPRVGLHLSSGGTLTGAGEVRVGGEFVWTGGTVMGTGKLVLEPDTRVEFSGVQAKSFRDRTIESSAHVVWKDTGVFQIGGGARWVNQPGAIFDIQANSSATFWFQPSPVFVNDGEIRKTVPGDCYFDFQVENSGVIQVDQGRFLLRQGGILDGEWHAAAGATVAFFGGTFEDRESGDLMGDGVYLVGNGGIYRGVANKVIAAKMELDLGGAMEGDGVTAFSNSFVWRSGTLQGAGKTHFLAGSQVQISGAAGKNFRDRTVENFTNVSWPDDGTMQIGGGARWINRAGAVLNISGNGSAILWFAPVPVFQNEGELRKGGSGDTYFDFRVENTAQIKVNQGRVLYRQGGVLGGEWKAEAGAIQAFFGGVFDATPSGNLTGDGVFVVGSAGTYRNDVDKALGINLELDSGGSLDGSGVLTMNRSFVWRSGMMAGTGVTHFASGSSVGITGAGTKSLRDRRIENRTQVSWTDNGTMQVGGGARWVNAAGSMLDIQGAGSAILWFNPTPVFENAGEIRKSAPGDTYFDFRVENTGRMDIRQGRVLYRQGGSLGGVWNVEANAISAFYGGIFDETNGGEWTGEGLFVVGSAGTYRNDVDKTLNISLELDSGGILDGSGALQLAESFTWKAGGIAGTGMTRFMEGSAISIEGAGTKSFRDRVIDNHAEVIWRDSGTLQVGGGARWINQPGSVLEFAGNGSAILWFNPTPIFENHGEIRKAFAGDSYFDFRVENNGLFSGVEGRILMRQGGVLGGSMAVASNAIAAFYGGIFEMTEEGQLGGEGKYEVGSIGTISTAVDVDLDIFLEMTGGTMEGSGTYRLGKRFRWLAGSIAGQGRTILEEACVAEIETTGTKTIRDRVLENRAQVVWKNANLVVGGGARWINQPGSTVEILEGSSATLWFAPVPIFENMGNLVKTGPERNVLDFHFENSGTMRLEGGSVWFRQGIKQTAGELFLDSSEALGIGALVRIDGGVLSGTGLMEQVEVGQATIRPGNDLGRIQLTQGLTLTEASVSRFQIGGTEAGVNYDQIVATQGVRVGGTLVLERVNGFKPTADQTYVLVQGGVREGQFNAVQHPSGFIANVVYTPTTVQVNFTESGVTAPTLVTQPIGFELEPGVRGLLTVVAEGEDLEYQWRKNGLPIEEATGASLEFPSLRFSDQARYSVVVSNGGGAVLSEEALVKVLVTGLDAGLVAYYPMEGNFADVIGGRDGVGRGDYTFDSSGIGDGALNFSGNAWVELGENPSLPLLDSANAFSVTFWIQPTRLQGMVPIRFATGSGEFAMYMGTTPGDIGGYYFGFRGQPAVVATAPEVYIQPNLGVWSQVTLVYNGGNRSEIGSYAAYFNGLPLALGQRGPIGGSLNLNEIGRNEAGTGGFVVGRMDDLRVYERQVSGEEVVALFAQRPPSLPAIVTQPGNVSAALGGVASFQVSAIGGVLSYQWRRNGENLVGQTLSNLVLSNLAVSDAGLYDVVVSNTDGEVVSQAATLTVNLPPPQNLQTVNTGTTNFIVGASFLSRGVGCVAYRSFGYGVTGGGIFNVGGGNSGVLVTTNGGQSWTPSDTGVTNELTAIRLVGSVGFISGTGGLLCISTNNGASWFPYSTGTSETFNDISFYNSQSGFAVGTGGIICLYNGRGWTPVPTGVNNTFYGVAAVGSSGYAVGSGGIICRYNGSTWVQQVTGTQRDFYGVAFWDEGFGFAVGSGGLLCVYRNGVWSPLDSGVSVNLRNIAFVNDKTILIVGDGGVVLRSVDGGLTWQVQGIGGGVNLGGLAFGGGQGFLFGASGAGFTFTVPNIPVNQAPIISIIQPADEAEFNACVPILVNVTARDPDGTVAKVEIFRGQFRLAEITQAPRPGSPYTTQFFTDALGEYQLRATATDNLGAVTVSEFVTIRIVPPPFHVIIPESYTEAGFSMCYLADFDRDYVLQATESLTPPLVWKDLSTNRMVEPLLRVTDPEAGLFPKRFYQFIQVPIE